MRVTRRGLLKSGGAGAGAALAARGLALAPAAVAQERDVPNALVVAVSNLRFDHVSVYGASRTVDTPNMDELAKDSLRFKNAMPESMPGVPAQRAAHHRHALLPVPRLEAHGGLRRLSRAGGPVHSIHPLVTEVMRAGGVDATYVTRQPVPPERRPLRGLPAPERRPGAPGPRRCRASDPSAADIERDMIDALDRDEAAAERTIDTGIELLGGLGRGGPFFLGLDGLDPQDTVEVPAAYVDKRDHEPIRQGGPPYAPIYAVDARAEHDRPRARALRGLRPQRRRHGRPADGRAWTTRACSTTRSSGS